MTVFELIDALLECAKHGLGHHEIYIEVPSFTDGQFDGMELSDNFELEVDVDKIVVKQ